MNEYLEQLKNYHRPLISILFATTLAVVLMGCSLGGIECVDNTLAMTVVGFMGSWLGVYTVVRTGEKITELKKK